MKTPITNRERALTVSILVLFAAALWLWGSIHVMAGEIGALIENAKQLDTQRHAWQMVAEQYAEKCNR